MSVVSTRRLDNQGTDSLDSGPSYESTYLVEVSSEQDGPQVVLSGAAIPTLGSLYVPGNDIDVAAICTSISPRRVQGNRKQWSVTLSFGPRTPYQRFVTVAGEVTSNPLAAKAEVTTSFLYRQEPVYLAQLRQTLTRLGRNIADWVPITNSAGDPVRPVPTRDTPILSYRLRRNRELAPVNHALVGAVNSDNFTLTHPGMSMMVVAYQALLVQIGGTLKYVNDTTYWEIESELHIRIGGWRLCVVDQGLNIFSLSGEADGEGGVTTSADYRNGQPPLRRLRDIHGNPITEPVLLNGDGRIAPRGQKPKCIYYSLYPEHSFSPLVGREL